jgi:DNA-binding transcriptional LysR family regulator
MSRMREDLKIGVEVLRCLSAINHTLRSWPQVAKRVRVYSEEKVTRPMARLEALVCGKLTEIRNNRLVPSQLGDAFYPLGESILALDQGEIIESLSVVISPCVDPVTVARATIPSLNEWGSLVGFRLVSSASGIREIVENDQAAFGIIGVGVDPDEADESLSEWPLPLVAVVPGGHRLSGTKGPLDRDFFAASDRVFFAPPLAEKLSELLTRVPSINRVVVECPQTLRVLVESGAGVGFEYAHPTSKEGEGFTRVPVVGVEPLVMGLVLPRKQERLTEPARFFLDALRRGPDLDLPPIPSLDELLLPTPELPAFPERSPA